MTISHHGIIPRRTPVSLNRMLYNHLLPPDLNYGVRLLVECISNRH